MFTNSRFEGVDYGFYQHTATVAVARMPYALINNCSAWSRTGTKDSYFQVLSQDANVYMIAGLATASDTVGISSFKIRNDIVNTNDTLSGYLIVWDTPTISAGSNRTVASGTPSTLGGSPTASGGLSPYTYKWSPATFLSSKTASNPTATITASTTYKLTVYDSHACSSTAQVIVTKAGVGLVSIIILIVLILGIFESRLKIFSLLLSILALCTLPLFLIALFIFDRDNL